MVQANKVRYFAVSHKSLWSSSLFSQIFLRDEGITFSPDKFVNYTASDTALTNELKGITVRQ
jgi:hypothetical protein